MPEYLCKCCNFKTNIKSKLQTHLETKKHLIKFETINETLNETNEKSKDIIIEELKQEIMFLKGKLEAYDLLIPHLKPVAEPVTKPVAEPVADQEADQETDHDDDPIDCDDVIDNFVKSFELEINEDLIEDIAQLREQDDLCGTIDESNIYHSFFSNEKNNLPFINEFKELEKSSHVFSNLIIENVLNKCSVNVTEKYKGRFKLFCNGKWLSVEDSREKVIRLFLSISSHFRKYPKLMKHYFCYDSQLKELDTDKSHLIRQLIIKLTQNINNNIDYDEEIKYILQLI